MIERKAHDASACDPSQSKVLRDTSPVAESVKGLAKVCAAVLVSQSPGTENVRFMSISVPGGLSGLRGSLTAF